MESKLLRAVLQGILGSTSSGANSASSAASAASGSSQAASSAGGADGVFGKFFAQMNWQLLLCVVIGVLVVAILAVGYSLFFSSQKRRKNGEVSSENGVAGIKPIALFRKTEKIFPKNGKFTKIIVGNSQNIGKRENQQDSFALSDVSDDTICSSNGVFAVVADGMGGLQNGAEVSSLVVSTMLSAFENRDGGKNPAEKLSSMLDEANSRVNRYLASKGNVQSGSTVVSVIIQHSNLFWIAVGDSRIYLFRKNRLFQLNQPHNLAAELDEKVLKGEITREEALSSGERNALTSYIGIGELELIDSNITPFPLEAGDKILLCTDGVFGSVSEEEITQAMLLPPSQAADALEQMVINKGKRYQDNMTAVVLECS